METLTLKDLKDILTNYKKENSPDSITKLNKDELINIINKYDILNKLNINTESDLTKLYKPKKEKKPRKPRLSKEEKQKQEEEKQKIIRENMLKLKESRASKQ